MLVESYKQLLATTKELAKSIDQDLRRLHTIMPQTKALEDQLLAEHALPVGERDQEKLDGLISAIESAQSAEAVLLAQVKQELVTFSVSKVTLGALYSLAWRVDVSIEQPIFLEEFPSASDLDYETVGDYVTS